MSKEYRLTLDEIIDDKENTWHIRGKEYAIWEGKPSESIWFAIVYDGKLYKDINNIQEDEEPIGLGNKSCIGIGSFSGHGMYDELEAYYEEHFRDRFLKMRTKTKWE